MIEIKWDTDGFIDRLIESTQKEIHKLMVDISNKLVNRIINEIKKTIKDTSKASDEQKRVRADIAKIMDNISDWKPSDIENIDYLEYFIFRSEIIIKNNILNVHIFIMNEKYQELVRLLRVDNITDKWIINQIKELFEYHGLELKFK